MLENDSIRGAAEMKIPVFIRAQFLIKASDALEDTFMVEWRTDNHRVGFGEKFYQIFSIFPGYDYFGKEVKRTKYK